MNRNPIPAGSREDLLQLIEDGEILPEEGEREAQRRGWRPLNPLPDRAKFDPDHEVYWSFVMAIAWIAWRDTTKVCEFWEVYRQEVRVWRELQPPSRPPGSPGTYLVSIEAHGTYRELELDACLTATLGEEPILPVEEARKELWRELQAQRLTAEGIDRVTGKRVEIPAREFQDLELRSARGEADRLVSKGLLGSASYAIATVKREDVQGMWSRLNTKPLMAGQSATKSRPASERALRALTKVYPDGVPDQSDVPNASLCRRVGEQLKKDGLPGVSDDTILRAAGRRRK